MSCSLWHQVRTFYHHEYSLMHTLLLFDNKVVRCHNVKNGKEVSEVTEKKYSNMRWVN